MAFISRRNFIEQGVTLLAASWAVPSFIAETARIVETEPRLVHASPSAAPGSKILVLVQLAGGNDGLNTVIPYADPAYYSARPTIAVPQGQVRQINASIGLAPQLQKLKTRYDRGQMAIVQGVSYPNPTRSHFRGMDIWESAVPDRLEPTGWMGRYIQSCGCQRPDHLEALSLGTPQQPYTFWNEMALVPAVASLGKFRYTSVDTSTPGFSQQRTTEINTLRQALAQSDGTPEGDLLRQSINVALTDADVIQQAAATYTPVGNYPQDQDVFGNSFGDSFKLIAQLIKADVGTKVFYIGLAGFDTHGSQGPQGQTHGQLLGRLDQAIDAFLTDMEAIGRMDDVLVMTFSEFGRRVAQNGSLGTDHGVAAPMLLFGGGLNGGLHGTHPSLTDLDAGDLKIGIDFRQVYATILQDWMSVAPSPILGGTFQTLPLIQGATPPPNCTPRPPVKVATSAGGGQLNVQIDAGGGRIREIRFGAGQNARIDVGTQTNQSGNFTHRPSSATGRVNLVVRRAAAGATTVPFVVQDDCGDWTTFVGGGPGAF